MCKGWQVICFLNSLTWVNNTSLETKSPLAKLWLNPWLALDMNFGFIRERDKGSSRNELFKKVNYSLEITTNLEHQY